MQVDTNDDEDTHTHTHTHTHTTRFVSCELDFFVPLMNCLFVCLFFRIVPDSYTLHAGCDVIEGEKYIANYWLRNRRIDGRLYDSNV
jgi:hypothetical protein